MKITKVNVHKIETDSNLRAFVRIVFDDCLSVTGLKLFENENGEYYLSYPKNPKSKQNYFFSYPVDIDFKKQIEDLIVEEYTKL